MDPNSKTFFISYAREDGDFALKLAKDLRQAGANLWIDQLDIRAGERWDRSIEKALEICSGMLLILSPDSVGSPNVMDEVSYVLEEGKRVLPVMYRDCKLPFRLRRVQHIDFTESYDIGLKRLLRDLQITEKQPVVIKEDQSSAVERPVVQPDTPSPSTPTVQTSNNNRWIYLLGLLVLLLGAFGVYRLMSTGGGSGDRSKIEIVERNGKFGYQTTNGKVLIPAQYDEAKDFMDDRAEVRMGEHWFVINIKGDCIEGCEEDQEQVAWEEALKINTNESYRAYLTRYPDGPHAVEARQKIRSRGGSNTPQSEPAGEEEQRFWDAALNRNSAYGYRMFLEKFPNGKYVEEAKKRLEMVLAEEEEVWAKVIRENSVSAYKKYLEAYPNGKYSQAATDRIKGLESSTADQIYWDKDVDEKPVFPGGYERLDRYVKSILEYPRGASEKGTVVVRYVVEKDGSISTIEVAKSTDRVFNKEAERIFKVLMEKGIKFEPGIYKGRPARVWMFHEVQFAPPR